MSDKTSLWAAVKDNWAQITGIGAVLVSLHLFVMWVMVGQAVSTKLSEQDLATDSNIMAINTHVAANKRTGEENAEDISHNRRNVEAAFAALMGRPVPDPPDSAAHSN